MKSWDGEVPHLFVGHGSVGELVVYKKKVREEGRKEGQRTTTRLGLDLDPIQTKESERTHTHVYIPRWISHDHIERPEHLEIELPHVAADPTRRPAAFLLRFPFRGIGNARDERTCWRRKACWDRGRETRWEFERWRADFEVEVAERRTKKARSDDEVCKRESEMRERGRGKGERTGNPLSVDS